MSVIITNHKRCDVIKMDGRIDSSNAPQLEEAMNSITDAGRHKIVFDMTDVNFVSSKGWWVMIETQKKCKRYNRGEVILVNVKPNIKDSLDLVGMDSYYQMFDDITDAVGSF